MITLLSLPQGLLSYAVAPYYLLDLNQRLCSPTRYNITHMKLKIRITDDQLVIYREKIGVVIYVVMAAVLCIVFGLVFFYVGYDEDLLAFVAFGIFSFAMGILILLGLPTYYKRLRSESGALLLIASNEGLSISPMLNAPTRYHYDWDVFEKIVLTNRYVEKSVGERGSSRNLMFIFLRNNGGGSIPFFEYIPRQIVASPEGNYYMSVPFPDNELDNIKKALDKFSNKKIPIITSDCVEFNFTKKMEKIEPEHD